MSGFQSYEEAELAFEFGLQSYQCNHCGMTMQVEEERELNKMLLAFKQKHCWCLLMIDRYVKDAVLKLRPELPAMDVYWCQAKISRGINRSALLALETKQKARDVVTEWVLARKEVVFDDEDPISILRGSQIGF